MSDRNDYKYYKLLGPENEWDEETRNAVIMLGMNEILMLIKKALADKAGAEQEKKVNPSASRLEATRARCRVYLKRALRKTYPGFKMQREKVVAVCIQDPLEIGIECCFVGDLLEFTQFSALNGAGRETVFYKTGDHYFCNDEFQLTDTKSGFKRYFFPLDKIPTGWTRYHHCRAWMEVCKDDKGNFGVVKGTIKTAESDLAGMPLKALEW